MGNDAGRTLGASRLAIRAGPRRQARDCDGRRWMTEVRREAQTPPSDSCSTQEFCRIDRGCSLAYLEMELGGVDVAGLTGASDHLSTLDRIPSLHQKLLCVGIGGDIAVWVTYQDKIAVTFELVAGISHYSVLGCLYRRVFRNRNIDSIILLPVGRWTKRVNDAPIGRPSEPRQ